MKNSYLVKVLHIFLTLITAKTFWNVMFVRQMNSAPFIFITPSWSNSCPKYITPIISATIWKLMKDYLLTLLIISLLFLNLFINRRGDYSQMSGAFGLWWGPVPSSRSAKTSREPLGTELSKRLCMATVPSEMTSCPPKDPNYSLYPIIISSIWY